MDRPARTRDTILVNLPSYQKRGNPPIPDGDYCNPGGVPGCVGIWFTEWTRYFNWRHGD